MITIHHIKETNVQADLHLYCGRKGACKRTDLVFANLGNPHFMHDESQREDVCQAYKCDLVFDLQHPHWTIIKRIGLRLSQKKSVALYCFCAPKECHCETIAEFATQCARTINDPVPFPESAYTSRLSCAIQ